MAKIQVFKFKLDFSTRIEEKVEEINKFLDDKVLVDIKQSVYNEIVEHQPPRHTTNLIYTVIYENNNLH